MNDISFTSRFQFVNAKGFENFRRGAYIDFRTNSDLTALDMINMKIVEKAMGTKIKHPRLDVVKADEFFTEEVRTCSAGGVVDTKTGEAAGFHAYDSLDNLNKVEDILENLFGRVPNANRAFIVGSKDLHCAEISIPMFKAIYEGIAKRIKNVTVFREHTLPYSETDFHYASKNDTWTIHSMYRPLTDIKQYDVTTKEELNKCFKEIKLANGDVLVFPEDKLKKIIM
jgi:hypothetical protein